MDWPTVSLLLGLVSGGIGIATFISGRMAKAERSGALETKIEQALQGISDIKETLEEYSKNQHSNELVVRSHEEQLKTLFNQVKVLQDLLTNNTQTYDLLRETLSFMRDQKSPKD